MAETNAYLLVEPGYYLVEFAGGEIVDVDGGHSGPEGVAKALKLWQRMGYVRSGRFYRMVHVEAVPEHLDPLINEEAAADMGAMLDRRREKPDVNI